MSIKAYDNYKVLCDYSILMDCITELKEISVAQLEKKMGNPSLRQELMEKLKEMGYPTYNQLNLRLFIGMCYGYGIVPSSVTLLLHSSGLYMHVHNMDAPQQREYIDKMVSDGKISDFHYQDQTDPSYDGIEGKEATNAEVEHRLRVLSEIFAKSATWDVTEAGFTMEMIDTYYFLQYLNAMQLELMKGEEWVYRIVYQDARGYHVMEWSHEYCEHIADAFTQFMEKKGTPIKCVVHTEKTEIYNPQSKNRWVRCCDGQPDENGVYLVLTAAGTVLLTPYVDGGWIACADEMKAWMPVPEDDVEEY